MLFIISLRSRHLEEAESHLESNILASTIEFHPSVSSAFSTGPQLTQWPSDLYRSSCSFFCFVTLTVVWKCKYSHNTSTHVHFSRVSRCADHECRAVMLATEMSSSCFTEITPASWCGFFPSILGPCKSPCHCQLLYMWLFLVPHTSEFLSYLPRDWLTSLCLVWTKFSHIIHILHKFLVPAKYYSIVCIYSSGVLKFLGHSGIPFLTNGVFILFLLLQQHTNFPVSPHLHQYLSPLVFPVIAIPTDIRWYSGRINSMPQLLFSCHGVAVGHYTSTQAEPANVHGIRAYRCRRGEAKHVKQDERSWETRTSRLQG